MTTFKTKSKEVKMPGVGSGGNPASHKSGARNLAKYTRAHGHTAPLKHGVYSVSVRRKFRDKRTNEGKQLSGAMTSVLDGLGGPENLDAAQQLILSGLESKLIVVLTISNYLEKQTELIGQDGKLIHILRKDFLNYSKAIKDDLMSLYTLRDRGKPRNIPRLQDIINAK